MTDTIGLIFIVLLLAGMGLLCVRGLRRYNPDGDKCRHGVRGGDGFVCRLCTPFED